MAKYDKVDPIAGSFRAKLNAALTLTNGGFFGGVSLNATGKVVVGTAGQSGFVGVLVKNAARAAVKQWDATLGANVNAYAPVGCQAGDVVDIMTNGDIVDLDPTVFVAGSKVWAKTDGTIEVGAGSAGSFPIGWTVEAGHLIVRIAAGVAAHA